MLRQSTCRTKAKRDAAVAQDPSDDHVDDLSDDDDFVDEPEVNITTESDHDDSDFDPDGDDDMTSA